MKSTLVAQPEALIPYISDLFAVLENEYIMCEVLVMSTECFASLLSEDQARAKKCIHCGQALERQVTLSGEDVLKTGNIATIWAAKIYCFEDDIKGYELKAYGEDFSELELDYPHIYKKFMST